MVKMLKTSFKILKTSFKIQSIYFLETEAPNEEGLGKRLESAFLLFFHIILVALKETM